MYIWTVVVLIIVSSHYYTIAAKLTGRNAVQVLATLFLMSYAKLLRITITAFSFTVLEYPNSSFKRIWLYDGNVEYLKGRHIALFLATLLLLLTVSLPYTVVLLFIQCLQYRSQYRILLWVQRLKPLFDAYTGPYKGKHRYWPGLLLVIRAVPHSWVLFCTTYWRGWLLNNSNINFWCGSSQNWKHLNSVQDMQKWRETRKTSIIYF